MEDEELSRICKRRELATAEVNRVRGDFLAAMIDLEAHLDRAIVYFFSPDEFRIFIDTILERMSFMTKIDTLRKMLRLVEIDESRRAFVKEVDALRVERNKFAHQGFDFEGNSYMFEGADYELYRMERLDPGPRFEDIIRLSDLRALVERARTAAELALVVSKEITAAHDPPRDYFQRPGWDPRGRFGVLPEPLSAEGPPDLTE